MSDERSAVYRFVPLSPMPNERKSARQGLPIENWSSDNKLASDLRSGQLLINICRRMAVEANLCLD